MNILRHVVHLAMTLLMCILVISCSEPRIDVDNLQDEFEVVLSFPRGKAASSRSTISDDPYVKKVYAKVYNSSEEHLPAIDATSDIPGVTKLKKTVQGDMSWYTGTIKLTEPVSGMIFFEVWGATDTGARLYAGEASHVVGFNSNFVNIATQATDPVGSIGQAGGYIFYDDLMGYDWNDNGTIDSDEWDCLDGNQDGILEGVRFLEAAPYDWNGGTDPGNIFGYYRIISNLGNHDVATDAAVGKGKANTEALVTAMSSAAYSAINGDATTPYYVAKMCDDYTDGTYDDWFLPSKDELHLMYQKLKVRNLGGFTSSSYWSSTEVIPGYGCLAWTQSFYNGSLDTPYRHYTKSYRPVRAF